MTDWPDASTQLPCCAPAPVSTRLVPLKPTSMMTVEPGGDRRCRGCHGGLGARGDDERAVDLQVPFGARIVASTNAPSVPALAIEQPSPSCHGVARPAAVSGLAGTAIEQFIEAAAWAAVWFMLIAAPVPSTGVVATSPSVVVATAPLANELAGGDGRGRSSGARTGAWRGRRARRGRPAGGRRGRRARSRVVMPAERRLVDVRRPVACYREDHPERYAQRHWNSYRDRNARSTPSLRSASRCRPLAREHSIHLRRVRCHWLPLDYVRPAEGGGWGIIQDSLQPRLRRYPR